MNCLLCNGNTLSLGTHPCLKDWCTGVFFCKDCGSIFRHPMPSIDKLSEYYEHVPFCISDRILELRLRRSRFQANALKQTLLQLDFPLDGYIIDIGAGIGGLVFSLREIGFMNTIGMEPRQIARDYASKTLNLTLNQGWLLDANKFIDKNRQHLLILSHVMEHLADPSAALKYLKKHFSGSLLWIEVPDGENDARMQDNHVVWQLWLEQHLISYTAQGLATLLEENGMQIIKIERGAVHKMLPKIRDKEFDLSYLCFEASNKIDFSPRILTKLLFQLTLYLPAFAYRHLLLRFPSIQMPDSPFYLRITARI